jgi:hypothetical protein
MSVIRSFSRDKKGTFEGQKGNFEGQKGNFEGQKGNFELFLRYSRDKKGVLRDKKGTFDLEMHILGTKTPLFSHYFLYLWSYLK